MFKNLKFLIILVVALGFISIIPKTVFADRGDYTGVSFSTSGSGNDFPVGITSYNDFFWIVDGIDSLVYKYNPDGSYTGVSFDLAGSGNTSPYGITAYNDFFWVTDYTDLEVYKYNPDGSYTGVSFDLAGSGSSLPTGITALDDFFYISDYTNSEVYKYNPDGTYTGTHFNTSNSPTPQGIVAYDGFLWIPDDTYKQVSMYYPDGTYTNFYFGINSSGNSAPLGIAYYNNYFWLTDLSDIAVYKYEAVDAIAPLGSPSFPSDNAVDVDPTVSLSFVFNEVVSIGTGNITIKKSSDDSIVEAIDVEGGQVTKVGQSMYSIDPSSDLEAGVSYYVQMDAGVFEDLAGNPFAGIADATTWNFTTDGTPPSVVNLHPIDDKEGFSANGNLIISFDESVVAGTGNITIKKSTDDSVVEIIDVTDGGLVNVSGGDVTINPSSDLELSTSYYVLVDSGAIKDNSGNSFTGITDKTTWNFTVGEFRNLYDFDSTPDGANPYYGPLLTLNGIFYGLANGGGANGAGTIFSYDPTLDTFTNLYDLDYNSDGGYPSGSFINISGIFYGITSQGGANGAGTIFSYDPTLDTFTNLYDLDSIPDGGNSSSSLIDVNGILYGLTSQGGANGAGTIFSYDPTLDTFTNLYDLDSSPDGGNPSGSLVNVNGILFGMTYQGGANNYGTVFSYDPTLDTFTNLYDLDNNSNGGNPSGSLINVEGVLYGMTYQGGANGAGTIFSYDPTLDIFTNLYDLDLTPDGGNPYGSLLSANGVLYGSTSGGGENSYGTVFSYDPTLDTFTNLHDFDSPYDGSSSYSSLISVEGILYGMTYAGGANGAGTIFSYDLQLGDEEPTPEPTHHTSSGSTSSLIAKSLLNNLAPTNLPSCLVGQLFNTNTGLPCTNTVSKFIFLNNLGSGTIHPDVLQLQKYLNTHGFSVALAGAGSLGHETTKFGKLTREALIKFQVANHITPGVGFFGPITRGVVNSSI